MIETTVLTGFASLLDKLLSILNIHRQSRKAVFQHIVEPLFTEMPAVVQDYLELLSHAEASVYYAAGDGFLVARGVLAEMATRREKLLAVRIKLREMASIIRYEFDNDQAVVTFAERVEKFFYSLHDVKLRSSASDAQTVVDLLDALSTSDVSAEEVYNAIKTSQGRLEHAWAEVTRAYALVRIRWITG